MNFLKGLRYSFLFVFLFFLNSSASAGELLEPNFKATTENECIQEKECFWYHFVSSIQTNSTEGKVTKNINLKKWDIPIRFVRIGLYDQIKNQDIADLFNELSPAVSLDIEPNKKYNYAIIFTDDIESVLSGPLKEPFNEAFGADLILESYRTHRDPCHYVHMHDATKGHEIVSYFAFVQTDQDDVLGCVQRLVYTGFGLNEISNRSLIGEDKNPVYSKLDRMLLFMLYQDYFKSGMSYEEARQSFDDVYDKLLGYLREEGVIHD